MATKAPKTGPTRPKSTIKEILKKVLKGGVQIARTIAKIAFMLYSIFKLAKVGTDVTGAIAAASASGAVAVQLPALADFDAARIALSAFYLAHATAHAIHDGHQAKQEVGRSIRFIRSAWKRLKSWLGRVSKK